MVETFCLCLLCFFVCVQATRYHNQLLIDWKQCLTCHHSQKLYIWMVDYIKVGYRNKTIWSHTCVGGRSTDIKTHLLFVPNDRYSTKILQNDYGWYNFGGINWNSRNRCEMNNNEHAIWAFKRIDDVYDCAHSNRWNMCTIALITLLFALRYFVLQISHCAIVANLIWNINVQ